VTAPHPALLEVAALRPVEAVVDEDDFLASASELGRGSVPPPVQRVPDGAAKEGE